MSDTLIPADPTPTPSAADVARMVERVKVADSGCHEWKGAKTGGGYGQFVRNGVRYLTHRVMYEHHKGAIPDGLQIDHLCRNRACCNPDHLEAVTNRENTRRGKAGLHRKLEMQARTHCCRGHEYNEVNTRIDRHGHRCCRKCEVILQTKYNKQRIAKRTQDLQVLERYARQDAEEAKAALLVEKQKTADLSAEVERLREKVARVERETIERCAKVADDMPAEMLFMWERPGGPPGNGYGPTKPVHVAQAIRALIKEPSHD